MPSLTASVVDHGEEQTLTFQCEKAKIAAPFSVFASVSKPNGFPERNEALEKEISDFADALPPVPYIGHDGHFVINPQYRTVYTFTFGKAHVKKSNYGYGDIIDKQGVDVSDKFSGCDYDWISEGLVLGTEKQHTIIRNHYGDLMATTQKFDNWGRFSEGLCKVLIGKKWGFIDKKGLVAINPLYDNVSNFHDGVAIVVVDDKYGLIDHKGNVVVEPQYLHIGSIPHFWAGSSETMLKSDMLPKYSCRLDINRTKKKKK